VVHTTDGKLPIPLIVVGGGTPLIRRSIRGAGVVQLTSVLEGEVT